MEVITYRAVVVEVSINTDPKRVIYFGSSLYQVQLEYAEKNSDKEIFAQFYEGKF